MKYQLILQSQKDFFHSGATLPVPYRLEVLSLLRALYKTGRNKLNPRWPKTWENPNKRPILLKLQSF